MGTDRMKDRTVLVIDDDMGMLQLLQRTLKTGGYGVCLAADGRTGLALLKEKKPDLVLLDIIMPGIDGLMILDSIRKFSNVPVIMVSAKPVGSAIEASTDLGADDYIEKPFFPSVLLARINAKLRRISLETEKHRAA